MEIRIGLVMILLGFALFGCIQMPRGQDEVKATSTTTYTNDSPQSGNSTWITTTPYNFTWITSRRDIESGNASQTFKVANWNLQIFGVKKAENITLLNLISNEIKKYDIVFVQEIRDSSNTAFKKLCDKVSNEYGCYTSSRAGRSSSKEQYGVFWKRNSINLTDWNDWNSGSRVPEEIRTSVKSNSSDNRWERPPLEVTFDTGNYNFTAFNIHTKPDDATNEINEIRSAAYSSTINTIILGDLNADCNYYKPSIDATWVWEIPDTADTTTGSTDCAYDRVLANPEMNKNFVGYGIGEGNGSDHHLIWVEYKR